jgi:hypothetical protein
MKEFYQLIPVFRALALRNAGPRRFFIRIIILTSIILSTGASSVYAASRYSVATGNWNQTSTWSATSGGSPGASVPVAGDDAIIEGAFTVTISANAACQNLTVSAASFLVVGGFTFTVSGATNISGTITHNNTSGTKTYSGLVTVNAGGNWNNSGNSAVSFLGGITNNGTFYAGTGVQTFNTNSQALNGNLTIPSITVTGVTLTNNGTLSVTTALAGTGGLTNASNATLNVIFSGAMGLTTLTATASGNKVDYGYNGAQTVKSGTYYNLTVSGSGVKTTTGVTVNGMLSMEGSATVSVAITYGATAGLVYNTSIDRTATVLEWPATFSATGGVTIANTGVIASVGSSVFGTGVPLIVNPGATLDPSNDNFTFGGDFILNGVLYDWSGSVTITGTATTQSISGFATSGAVSMTKTTGTATFTGTVNAAGLTINGSGGTLNLGTGLTHTFSGTWTRTAGTLNGGSSVLKIGGSVSGTGGTFTAGAGTVIWYAFAAQTVAGVTYNNLTLTGSGTKTTTGVAVNGILSIEQAAVVSTAPAFGGSATLQYNTETARTTSVEWVTPFTASGGVIITNTGIITLGAAKTFNAGIPLQVLSGATLSASTYSNTFGAGCTITINGTWQTSNSAGLSGAAGTSISSTNSPTVSLGASSTIDYNLSGAQTVTAITYANLTLSNSGAKTMTSVSTVNGAFTLSGSATATPATALTVGGKTILTGTSVLTLGAANILGNSNALSLDGGTFRTGSGAGFAETTGTLELTNISTLTLGTGTHSLNFASSSGIAWSPGKVLTITGWSGGYNGTSGTAGKLFIGTDATGLTASQLTQIRFYNGTTYYPATQLSSGEVVPIAAINYYSLASGALNLTTSWTSDITLATTVSPANFTSNNQVFNIRNQSAPAVAASWTVSGTNSKVILGDGTNSCNFTVGSTYVLTATVDISDNATLTLTTSGVLTGITFGTLTASGTVNYAGVAQTVVATTYANLVLSGSGTKTVTGLSTVSGNLTVSGTAAVVPASALAVGGKISLGSTGTLTLGAANVLVNTDKLSLNGGTFKTGATTGNSETLSTLELLANSTITLGTGVHSLNFDPSNGVSWTPGKMITVTGWAGGYNGTGGTSGKIIIGSDATGLSAAQLAQIRFYNGTTYYPAIQISSGEVVPVATINYYSLATGSLNLTSSWTSDISLATTVSPANFSANNQVFNIRNQASPTIAASWTVSGTNSKVIIGDGSTACNFTIPAGMTLAATTDIAANGILSLTTLASLSGITFGTLALTSTVNYNGAGAQTVIPVAYGNMTLAGSGTKTMTGVSTINGNFTVSGTASATATTAMTFNGDVDIESGATFVAGAFSHVVKGNWINNGGTFTSTGSTITFNNQSAEQSIKGTLALPTFNNLVVDKATSNLIVGGSITILTVSNALTMTSGNIWMLASRVLQLGTSTSSIGTLNYTAGSIVGSFMRWINATGAWSFPIGDGSSAGNVVSDRTAKVTFSDLTQGSLTATFYPNDPGAVGLPLYENSLNIVNQFTEGYWSMVAANSLASTNYDLELNGTGFSSYGLDAETRIIKRSDLTGDSWSLDNAGTHVAAVGSLAKRSGINGFSQFALATRCTFQAYAGPDQQKNNSSFTMAATLHGGTGVWTIITGSAVITTPTSPTTSITNVGTGRYVTLRWTETNGTCVAYDDVLILNDKNKDLINPDANIVTAPAGSLVIAMDDALQAAPGYFNLKAYGLAVSLLNNKIPLHWIIRAGKSHGDIDFSSVASQVYPVTSAPVLRDFRSGPILIFPVDSAGVGAIINTFNNGPASGAKVNIYRLTNATNVDERYILTQRPKVAVLNDGGNASIHNSYMINASIDSTNDNYHILSSAVRLEEQCFTFASEPHSNAITAVLDSIHSWVKRGGNFLAECLAINTYENNTAGHFLTTNGLTIMNVATSPYYNYPNADLSFGQYLGQFDPIAIGGAERNWKLAANSQFANNGYAVQTGGGSYSDLMGQAVAKHHLGPGHMVFFTGGHSYNGTSADEINGQRSYFNAMLTPSSNTKCDVLHFDDDILVTKVADISTVCPGGQNVTFTVTVKNTGPATDPAANLVLNETFPASYFDYVGTPSVTQGSYNTGTGKWTIGTLNLNASATLTIVAHPKVSTPPGTYTNKVKLVKYQYDVDQSNDSAQVDVSVINCLNVQCTPTHLTCKGSNDGSVTVSAWGGSGPYTYLWNTNATTQTIVGVSAGTFTVTVTDNNSSQATCSTTLTEPPALIAGISSTTHVSCYGLTDGSATVTASGGTTAYNYKWNTTPQQTTATAGNLGFGFYTVTVTDQHGCTTTATTSITQPQLLVAGISSSTHVSCYGLTDGSAVVTASGGTTAYAYKWNTTPQQTTATAGNLGFGSYTVTVTDQHGCTTTSATSITQPDPLNIALSIISPTCNNATGGSISTTVTGGTTAYNYIWSIGATTANITGLTVGTYSVTVTDAHNCQTSGSGTISGVCPWGPMSLTGDPNPCQHAVVTYCSGPWYPITPECPGCNVQDPYQFEWTVAGGTIIGPNNGECIQILWDACITGHVCLTVTNNCTGCIVTQCMDVTVNPTPQPDITGPVIVNVGTSATYCTQNVTGDLYDWAVTGGQITGGWGSNCITVAWDNNCTNCPGRIIVYECNSNGCCATDTLYVTLIPGTGNLDGFVTYKNSYNTGLNNVCLTLKNTQGTIIATTCTGNDPVTDATGYYTFSNIPDGSYQIFATSTNPWGGNNATDALIIQLYTVGSYALTGLNYTAADVNADWAVNSTDALWIKLRTVGMVGYYPDGDWVFDNPSFTLSGSLTLNFQGLCTGDENGSYIPSGFKETSFLDPKQEGIMTEGVNKTFDFPIRSISDDHLGAMTLNMNYDANRFDISGATTSVEGLKYSINDGRVSLAWSSLEGLNPKPGEALIILKMKAKQVIPKPVCAFSILSGSEFADGSAVRYDNYGIRMPDIATSTSSKNYMLTNYPNPFNSMTEIVYDIPEQGHVKLVLMNEFGEVLRVLAEGDQQAGSYHIKVDPATGNLMPGVYLYRIQVEGLTSGFTKTNKMIFTR